MIVVNKQANQNVCQTKVRNFYPKNPPKSAKQSIAQSHDNIFRHQQRFSQQMIPQNSTTKRLLEYMNTFGTPKYLQQDSSETEQIFYNTAPQFFQPQPNLAQSHTNGFTPQGNQAQVQMGQTFTSGMNKDKLNETRKNRQKMEFNVAMLKNRIHLLELKEKQTMHKMIETQKKTIDIIMNKTNHQKKIQEKNSNQFTKSESQIKRQFEVKQIREEKKMMDNIYKEQRIKSAQSQAKRIKDLKEIYATHQQFMQEEMQLRNAQSYETVKLQEKEQEIKRQQFMEMKQNQASQNYKNKCKTEIQKKTQDQLYYIDLEKKEQEFIRKLSQSQNLQKAGIQEMQKTQSQRYSPYSQNSDTFQKNNNHNYYFA